MFHVKHRKMQHVNQRVAFFFVKNLVGTKIIRSFALSFERETYGLMWEFVQLSMAHLMRLCRTHAGVSRSKDAPFLTGSCECCFGFMAPRFFLTLKIQ